MEWRRKWAHFNILQISSAFLVEKEQAARIDATAMSLYD